MHHWVKYCVNRCMKSEVIALTSFVTASPWRGTKILEKSTKITAIQYYKLHVHVLVFYKDILFRLLTFREQGPETEDLFLFSSLFLEIKTILINKTHSRTCLRGHLTVEPVRRGHLTVEPVRRGHLTTVEPVLEDTSQ